MHHEVHGKKTRAKEGQGTGKDGGLPGGKIHGGKGQWGRRSSLVRWDVCNMSMKQVRGQFRGMVNVEISKVPLAGQVVAGENRKRI